MNETLRIFLLLLKKSIRVRIKTWGKTIIGQILIPIGLFFLLINALEPMPPTEPVQNTTTPTTTTTIIHYPIQTKWSITSAQIPVDKFVFTPATNATTRLMASTRQCLYGTDQSKSLDGVSSEEMMVRRLTMDAGKNKSASHSDRKINSLGIVFETILDDSLPANFKYRLFTKQQLPRDLYAAPESHGWADGLLYSGIPALQMCLDQAYINWVAESTEKPSKQPEISIQQMPSIIFKDINEEFKLNQQIIVGVISNVLLIILCLEITFPAGEKAIGINVLMSVNGASAGMNLCSWLFSGAIVSTCYLAPLVIFMKHSTSSGAIPLLANGDPFILWLVLFFNVCHTISVGYHLSSYFSRPAIGIFATFMFLTVVSIINSAAKSAALQHFLIYVGFICPPLLLQPMINEAMAYEGMSVGIHWRNMFSVGSLDAHAEASVGVMLIFSIIGILLNFFMAVYLHAVLPGKYGVSQHPFFCFRSKRNMQSDNRNIDFETTATTGVQFEEIPRGTLEPGIRIRGLKKTYKRGLFKPSRVEAVKEVSADFYKGQITALLGHNGAGKTTTMSILSGLTSLSEGVVLVDGKNVSCDPNAIKNNIGLCPQVNIVFPELTVYQQVLFFGTLKSPNKTNREIESEVAILLEDVNLTDKRNSMPKELSGGQKRRLCLAMAVIGDGNVLILDEPTSGIDTQSKREVWDIVLKLRGEKTILISTHDMEEAEVLGDRIAIMHTGTLKSYGTSMFLKKLYGEGQVEVTLSVEPWCKPSKLLQEINVSAQLLNEDAGKLVLAIPQVESLPAALDHLESRQKDLGITGMSVSMITLEQVLLQVTRDGAAKVETREQIDDSCKVTGIALFIQCFFAFFVKNLIAVRKSPWLFWISLLIPCLASTVMLAMFGGETFESARRSLTLKAYDSPLAFVNSSNVDLGRIYARTVAAFGGSAEIMPQGAASNVTGALLTAAGEDRVEYRNRYIVSAEFNETDSIIKANGFYSGSANLGIPVTLNALSNAILQTVVHNETYRIEASAQLLPTLADLPNEAQLESIAILCAIIMCVVPAIGLHASQPLEEARSGVKQLQNMTGASKFAYWAAMFFVDYIQYLMSSLILLIALVLVDSSLGTKFFGTPELFIFMLLMMLFGMAMLPFIYCLSFLKKTFMITSIFITVAPMILGIADFIIEIVENQVEGDVVKNIHDVVTAILRITPFYSFGGGQFRFFQVASTNARCRRLPERFAPTLCTFGDTCCGTGCSNGVCAHPRSYFDDYSELGTSNLTTYILYLLGSFVLFSAVIGIIELQLVQKLVGLLVKKRSRETNTAGMDELVLRERTTVASDVGRKTTGGAAGDDDDDGGAGSVLLVHDLKKRYRKLEAVRGVSFRVKESECFGLLGVNGAGKSTTFRMLTGAERPDGGELWLKDFNIERDRMRYLQGMGYCPQPDTIMENLNARDHLHLFARLRGVPEDRLHDVASMWIDRLNLAACAEQPSGTYSGGNKRRLNIAIALIGNPSLVLLDEPTTGVDPAARRSLWDTLKACQASGQSIILTSHSMEECEVLCNRLVIMVKGQMVCVGASQELKQRFVAGYNIQLKLSPIHDAAGVHAIKTTIENHWRCTLTDEHTGFISYHVTDSRATWTIMYNVMNDLKRNVSCIEDFAILSSTLEQLFIQFARANTAERDVSLDTNGVYPV